MVFYLAFIINVHKNCFTALKYWIEFGIVAEIVCHMFLKYRIDNMDNSITCNDICCNHVRSSSRWLNGYAAIGVCDCYWLTTKTDDVCVLSPFIKVSIKILKNLILKHCLLGFFNAHAKCTVLIIETKKYAGDTKWVQDPGSKVFKDPYTLVCWLDVGCQLI